MVIMDPYIGEFYTEFSRLVKECGLAFGYCRRALTDAPEALPFQKKMYRKKVAELKEFLHSHGVEKKVLKKVFPDFKK